MIIYGYRYDRGLLGFSPLTKPYTPADGLISIERHAELMSAQGAGQLIVPDDKGNPIAIERPAPPTPSVETLAMRIRTERAKRLSLCDWTQLADAQLDKASKMAWATYRQSLRDLPQQDGFPWYGDISLAPWPPLPKKNKK